MDATHVLPVDLAQDQRDYRAEVAALRDVKRVGQPPHQFRVRLGHA
jgi:hypothetical protein